MGNLLTRVLSDHDDKIDEYYLDDDAHGRDVVLVIDSSHFNFWVDAAVDAEYQEFLWMGRMPEYPEGPDDGPDHTMSSEEFLAWLFAEPDCPHGDFKDECSSCEIDAFNAYLDSLAKPAPAGPTDRYAGVRAAHVQSKRRAMERRYQTTRHHSLTARTAQYMAYREPVTDFQFWAAPSGQVLTSDQEWDVREVHCRKNRLKKLKEKPWQAPFLRSTKDFFVEKKSRRYWERRLGYILD